VSHRLFWVKLSLLEETADCRVSTDLKMELAALHFASKISGFALH